MDQSSLSQSIRSLETRLGERLLTRTTRSVAPTPAGEMLLETLRPALNNIDKSLAALRDMRETPAGTVRLTASRHAAETVLCPAIARLSSTYPDIKVELSTDSSLTDIVTERYDAGIRLGERLAKDMIAVRIGPDLRMAVVGAPSYLEAFGTPQTPHELTQHRCINIRFPTAGALYAWEFEKDGRELNIRVEGPLVLNDSILACRAAVDGLGLAMVMESIALPALEQGSLIRVLEDWCPPFAGYHIYYPDRRHASTAFTALLAELRRNASQLPA